MIKILDFITFYAELHKDQILYENWYFQMLNKILTNKLIMLTEVLKLAYIQSFTADNTFMQLKPRLHSATKLFKTASNMFNVLMAAFGNANCKYEVCIKYRFLRQRNRDFSTF